MTIKENTDIRNELFAVIQSDFPAIERPFRVIAERAGLTEGHVINEIRTLLGDGTIRAFSPVFEGQMLGYTSTLAAAEVEPDSIDDVARFLAPLTGVTHNYLRDNRFNLWFTVAAPSEDAIQVIIDNVGNFSGVSATLNLPALRVYKVRAVFGATSSTTSTTVKPVKTPSPNEAEKRLVRILQEGLPITEQPYKLIAERMGIDEEVVLSTIRRWMETGTIRRFGARLNHHKAGFTANAMAVWDCGDSDDLGELFAAIPSVSHCYRRKTYPEWPLGLYTMVHACSESELSGTLEHMKSQAHGAEMMILPTISELKKTTMKYFLEDA